MVIPHLQMPWPEKGPAIIARLAGIKPFERNSIAPTRTRPKATLIRRTEKMLVMHSVESSKSPSLEHNPGARSSGLLLSYSTWPNGALPPGRKTKATYELFPWFRKPHNSTDEAVRWDIAEKSSQAQCVGKDRRLNSGLRASACDHRRPSNQPVNGYSGPAASGDADAF